MVWLHNVFVVFSYYTITKLYYNKVYHTMTQTQLDTSVHITHNYSLYLVGLWITLPLLVLVTCVPLLAGFTLMFGI